MAAFNIYGLDVSLVLSKTLDPLEALEVRQDNCIDFVLLCTAWQYVSIDHPMREFCPAWHF